MFNIKKECNINESFLLRANCVYVKKLTDTPQACDNITSKGLNQHHVPYNMTCQEGHGITYKIVPSKMHILHLIMKNYQTNPNYKRAVLYSLKVSQLSKKKKDYSRLKKTKGEIELYDPGLGPTPGKLLAEFI